MGKDLMGIELGSGICQRKDGIYQGRFVDRFGKRRTLYNSDLSTLKRNRKVAIKGDSEKKSVQTEYTLDEWYHKWLQTYKYSIRETSKLGYQNVYTKHIHPVLGHRSMANLTNMEVRDFLNQLEKEHYGFETRNRARILLCDMFDKALINDFAIKNPVRGIKMVRDETFERRVLTPEEQADFFDTCKGTFYDELFTVSVLTGLRPGEVCALRWQDIDLNKRVIHVTRTLIYQKFEADTKKEFHLGPPKTKTSLRDVPINDRCIMALKRQFGKKSNISLREQSSPLPGFEDLLFVTKYNTPINPMIEGPAIERIVALINESRSELDKFENFSAHCFRHTYATRCFEAGVDPKVIQKRLGHASLQMTMDLYVHLLPCKDEEEMEKFNSVSEEIFASSDGLAEKRFSDALHPQLIRLALG